MYRGFCYLLGLLFSVVSFGASAADSPDCSRRLTLALNDHGVLYSAETNVGINRDFADELISRSGCQIGVSVMPRARIWQLIESGALDFSLSGIATTERNRYAGFAWYFSSKYCLLVRRDAGVASLSDFARNNKLKLGAVRSFRYSKNTDLFLAQLNGQQRVDYADREDPLYQILALNRIQGMIVEPFDYLQVASVPIRDITTIIDTGDLATPHGLIMSNRTLSAMEQQKWRTLVDAMRADGTVRRIFSKYFSPELARAMTDF
ncbi:MAG: ABC transporter substrate-binding protein [Herbaspirillum sp.]